ncbi:MAG: hypothetical protein AB2754_15860 [Candidatus Thiodiazotropha endolucinida]
MTIRNKPHYGESIGEVTDRGVTFTDHHMRFIDELVLKVDAKAGAVSDAVDSVVSIDSPDATDLASVLTLANELKADVNQLVTDVNAIKTQLNALLASMRAGEQLE